MDGILFLAIAVVLLVFLMTRTRRQQRAITQVQDSVAVGRTVMTTSGVYGEVTGIGDDGVVEIEIAPGVRTRWLRAAVARVVDDADGVVTHDDAPGRVDDGGTTDPAQEGPAGGAPPAP